MATDSNKVLVGAAVVSVGAYVTAAGAGTLTDVGHTKSPVTLAPNVQVFDVKSERAFGTIKKVPLDMELKLKIPYLECTAEALRTAMRQPSGNVSGSGVNLTVRVGDPKEQYHQIQIVGPGPSGGTAAATRTITFWKCIVDSVAEIPFAKGDSSVYEVVFAILYDDSVSAADKFFKQVDSGGS